MAADKADHGFGKHFVHPIFQTWNKINHGDIQQIYCKGNQVYTEHTIRGDSVGRATDRITTLAQSFQPSVWALDLACGSSNWCVVFAPNDFDIKMFRQDLSLLFFLGTMGKLVNRRSFLKDWEVPSSLLSPGMVWGDAQGWWHTDQNVIVVCLVRKGAHDLWGYLSQTFSIPDDKVVHIRDYSMIEAGLLKSAELLTTNIQHSPSN